MNNKINKKNLKKMIDSGYTSLSSDTIRKLIDEELSKDENFIDTDYVDMCFKLLDVKNQEKPILKKHINKTKIMLIAATFSIIISIAVPVGAKFISRQADENIVKYVDSSFQQDLINGKTNALTHSDESNDNVKFIKKSGISDVIVPSIILNDFNVKNTSNEQLDGMTTLHLTIADKKSEISGYIDITQYNDYDLEITKGKSIMGIQYDTVKQITVNGMDVLIFSCDDNCSISYIDNHVEYFILLENCTKNEAIEIMKTLE